MHDTDNDIATLEKMFPDARADYRTLRHDGALPQASVAPRAAPSRRGLLIAASFVLILAGLGLLSWSAQDPGTAPRAPQMASYPGALPQLPSHLPHLAGVTRPSLTAARPTLGLSVPQRPGGSNG